MKIYTVYQKTVSGGNTLRDVPRPQISLNGQNPIEANITEVRNLTTTTKVTQSRIVLLVYSYVLSTMARHTAFTTYPCDSLRHFDFEKKPQGITLRNSWLRNRQTVEKTFEHPLAKLYDEGEEYIQWKTVCQKNCYCRTLLSGGFSVLKLPLHVFDKKKIFVNLWSNP